MNDPTPVRAVNCTQCGAPLKLHGGHRVRSLSCGSCGSVLDTKDEYQVVKQFADIQRPQMPLELGMQGKLKGIAFTIIGVVQYRDSEGYYDTNSARYYSPWGEPQKPRRFFGKTYGVIQKMVGHCTAFGKAWFNK
jgi:hypothetical protein